MSKQWNPKPGNGRGESRGPPNRQKRKNGVPKQPAQGRIVSSAVTRVVHAPALGSSLPSLVITYTNEPFTIAEWMNEHVPHDERASPVQCLGLDTETKPSFTKEAAKNSKGPDVLQLAKADGTCLVIHLSQVKQLQGVEASGGYIQLANVLKSRSVAKAGVGIDEDALELYENKGLGVNCRLDLTKIDSGDETNGDKKQPANSTTGQTKENHKEKSAIPRGLKGLSEYYIPSLTLPKQKKLQMSNWALPLSDAQVGYAAADAFVGALVVETLVRSKENQHTSSSFIASVLGEEIGIEKLRADRTAKKAERKRVADKKKRERKNVAKPSHQEGANKNAQGGKKKDGKASDRASAHANKNVQGGKKGRHRHKHKLAKGESKPLNNQASSGDGPQENNSNNKRKHQSDSFDDHPLNKPLRSRR